MSVSCDVPLVVFTNDGGVNTKMMELCHDRFGKIFGRKLLANWSDSPRSANRQALTAKQLLESIVANPYKGGHDHRRSVIEGGLLVRAFLPIFLTWGCLIVFIAQASWADEVDSEIEAKIKKLGTVFAPANTPSIAGKKWVAIETGPINYMQTIEGWLIEENPDRVLLLDFYGNQHPMRKPAADEKRQVLPTSLEGRIRGEDLEDADNTIVWGIKEKDFDTKSQKFLDDGPPRMEEEDGGDKDNIFRGINRFNRRKSNGINQVMSAARFAYAAYVRGRKEHAIELFRYAEERHREFMSSFVAEPRELSDVLRFATHQIAESTRNRAVYDAHHGEARGKLLQAWQEVAAMPRNKYSEEAQQMVEGYQQLIDQDTKWEEPTKEELAKFSVPQQIDYWFYHLRDHDYGQIDSPGECDVFVNNVVRDEEKPNPAEELAKLGTAVIPALIEHMDDLRPTRCQGHWRWYSSEGRFILRYGDCCQQIFERVTREQIYRRKTTTSYPTYDGSAADCKAKAQAWWDKYHKKQVETNK